jgi:hypothetical protein
MTIEATTEAAPVALDPLVAAISELPDVPEVSEETGDDAPAEETTEAPAETETTEEKPATEAAATPAVDEAKLFSDEALATKDGVKAAAAHLKAKQKDVQTRELIVSKRVSKLRAKVQAFGAEKEAVQKERETVATFGRQIQQDVAALQRGSAQEVLAALGRITGRDAKEIYREISHLMVTNGQSNGKANPEVAELRAKLEAMEQARAQEQTAAQEALLAQQENQAMDRIYAVGTSAAQFPAIAAAVAANPSLKAEVREWLAENVRARYNGVAYDPSNEMEAAKELEHLLVAARQPAGTTGATSAKSDTGPAPKVTKPAASITSAERSAPAQRKPRNDGATTDELANDSQFMHALGM